MKKNAIVVSILFVTTSVLSSCGIRQQEEPLVQKVTETQPAPAVATGTIVESTWSIIPSEKINSPEKGKDIASWSGVNVIQYTIENNSGSLRLPDDIWWTDIETGSYILSNDGWNVDTALKTPPEGTNTTTWGIHISNSWSLANAYIANVDTILGWIEKKESWYNEDRKMSDGSIVYSFWFEWGWYVNISLLKSLQKSGISKVSEEDLQKILVVWPSQGEKRIYSTKAIKNKKGELIAYGSACSFSQDPVFTRTFNSYCVLTFDGKYVKSYTYEIPMEFFKDVKDPDNIDALTSKYETAKTSFYAETKKFGEKMFNEMYANNKKFSDFINRLDEIAIENY